MSIWSSIDPGSTGEDVTLYDHDGYGDHTEASAEVDVAIAWGWQNGIRLCVWSNRADRFPEDGVLDRESAVLLRNRLTVAINQLDGRT